MVKKVVACAISASLGAAAMYVALPALGRAPSSSLPAARELFGAAPADERWDREAPSFAGARLATYLAAAELGSVSDLEAEIDRTVGVPATRGTHARLEALLLRYVEIDSQRAIRFALSRAIDRAYVLSMFRTWAGVDREAALAELERIGSPDLIKAVALALSRSNFDDVEHLASIVRVTDRADFRAEALAWLAESDPLAAMRYAVAADDHALATRHAAQRIAAEWAWRDPVGAISQVSNLVGEAGLRNAVLISVMREWVRIDPDAALEYIASEEGRGLVFLQVGDVVSAIDALAMRRPREALRAADSLPSDVRAVIRKAALTNIVDQDLESALDDIGRMPPGVEREELLRIVAVSYARQDPESAVEWARRTESASPGTTHRVVAELAVNDLSHAVDLALAMQGGTDAVSQMISPLPPPFGTPVTMNVDRLRKVADSLMAASQSRAIENLLQVWPQVDPSAAVTWLLEQGASMDPRHVRRLAAGFARGELPLSSEFPNTLPPESRGAWIAEVAGVYAATDLDAALTWLGRFEGEPGYDGWAASAAASVIASPVGATSPAAAAAILGTAQQPPLDVTARVASRWASREDPRGALEWAQSLRDPEAQSSGIAAAAGAWAASDLPAAQAWALTLPSGDSRDDALAAILRQGIVSHGSIERRMLSGFSSGAARDGALEAAIPAFRRLADSAPDRARALIDAYVEQPELRSRIERAIGR